MKPFYFVQDLVRRKPWPHPLTLVSAFLIVFSFPPWDLSFLVWIGIVPWLVALEKAQSTKRAVLQGFWLGFFMTLGGYSWVAYSLQEFGGVSWSVGILGLLLFCLIGQPQFLIFSYCFKKIARSDGDFGVPISYVLFAAFYTGVDWAAPKIFMDTLGHSLYRADLLRQLADLGGAPILTFLILLVNLGIYSAVHSLL
jgi:apolipoprotein N-acyltransferase